MKNKKLNREKISAHFTWQELLHSDMAVREGIPNMPSAAEREAISHLVTHLLEPLRECYQRPIRITSGYRSKRVNQLVGGVAGSQHCKGEAADCRTEDNLYLLHVLQEARLDFDQAILYCKRNILHLSLKRNGVNRKQVILK